MTVITTTSGATWDKVLIPKSVLQVQKCILWFTHKQLHISTKVMIFLKREYLLSN